MDLQDILENILRTLAFLERRVDELEGESESGGYSISFGAILPTDDLFSNRLYCLTSDSTGGPGGTLYRYDSSQGAWLRIS